MVSRSQAVPEEGSARALGTPPLPPTPFRFILYFVNQFLWWYSAMFLFETLTAVCGILVPYALSKIIKTVTGTQGHSQAMVDGLRGPLLLFFAFAVGEVVFSRTAGGLQFRFGPKQRQNVTRQLYRYLQAHSHRFLTDNFSGSLAHRIGETSMGVSQTLWAIITDFWPIAITLSVSIGLLSRAHHLLAGFVAIWAVLFISLSYLLARRAQSLAWKASAARSETTGQIVDTVTNLVSTKLFARLGLERDLLDETLSRELKAVRQSNRYTERVRWFQFSAAAVLKVGVLYFALSLWGKGAIGVADFVMAVSLSLLIINEARNLSRRFLEFFEFIGNVANGVSTIVRPHELIDVPEATEPVFRKGEIRFEDVRFAYAPDRPVFDGVTLEIPAGQRVGLVGFSGSGKSTFVSILLRLYDLTAGRILIDGHDIRFVKQDALHAQIGLIPQDPTLFHRSLRENIRYGRIEAADADVEAAARQAHADEFISRLREGYGAMVGERGVKLSGGQRQRIAIARVILKNAPILILDEATSSLDSITEKAIQETLDEAMRGKTVLVIAHRLSTIANLDRILVFDQGRIVEDGGHQELLAQRGAYWRLWRQQSHGFLPAEGQGDSRDLGKPGFEAAEGTGAASDPAETNLPSDEVEAANPKPDPALV